MTAVPSGPRGPALDFAALFEALPTAFLVMTPDLVIATANDAYLQTVGRRREDLVGRPVFEAFPPAEQALDETGVSYVQRSFERARDTGRPDTMPIQRYDLLDPVTGEYVEQFWSLISFPVLDADGRTALVVQRTENITDYLRQRRADREQHEQSEQWRRRVVEAEADLFARAQELQAAREAAEQAGRRLAALADVALELAQAQTVPELTAVIVDRGLVALGADGGALAVSDGGEVLQVAVSAGLGEQAQQVYGQLRLDAPLPAAATARTGERILLPDGQATAAFSPQTHELLTATGCVAWAFLPLPLKDELLGSLSVGWSAPHAFTADEVEVLDALAAQCAHGLDRIRSREAERVAAAAAQRMAETLQRSLLTEPPQPDDLQIVVRYRPAAQQAQVGGDWHDAFLTAEGATCLVIGDVAGHDRDAAAAMGQLRNMLRGVAFAGGDRPAAVLSTLDRGLDVLAVGSLATAVLARVERGEDQDRWSLRWSNAGHPPPLLVEPDGTVRLLQTPADLLLGLDPHTERADHEVLLAPGSAVLLYTDGLVERRDAGLDDGLAWLQRTAAALSPCPPDALCDALLEQVAGHAEDDIALLVLRVGGPGSA